MEMIEILKRFDFRCALTDSDEYHIDHFFPQALGGDSSIRNMYPLDATLNMRKGTQNPFEFFARDDVKDDSLAERFEDVVLWLALLNGMTVDEFREYTYERFSNVSVTMK